ncbi:putative E3 ubiquitin-protein ligase ARI16 [Cardamine amara subsp. amara]|uniref:RBR-type E3 ubiquitin transferase n=1 Tax=Cardamine amara subsp. amara TaxID=228776 RepID=A0ABD0ZNV9_CARAN
MEAFGESVYSILEKTQVRERMMKGIDQISEVFSISKFDATVILIHLRWNSFKAADLLGDNKKKFLAKLRLVQVFDLNQTESDSDGTGDYLVSTPFCSHKFSKTRWSEYLRDTLDKNKAERGGLISCLHQDCVASVGPDTIEQLTDPVKELYESYVLSSFVESNKGTIKWCPASGCDYAIELAKDKEDDDSAVVVCLCGCIFCWDCQLESHQPLTCKNASLWLNHLLGQSRSVAWIHSNTKPCPQCNSPVLKNDDPDYRIITCVCSYSFCWVCLGTEEEHNGYWNCVEVTVPPPENQENAAESSSSSSHEFSQILHLNLWEESHEVMEKAKAKLKAFETNMIPKLTENCGVSEADMRAFREAWMLVVQCRGVLKWSCVFDYFITDYQKAKKQYLKHLRDEATTRLSKHEGTLHELVEELMFETHSAEEFGFIKHKLETSTTNTGNYFHDYVKTLQDGLPEVKAEDYEKAPNSHWFCNRCTFQNTWDDKECKLCFVPHVAIDNNNQQQQQQQQPCKCPSEE